MLAPRSTRTTSRLVPSLLAVTGIVAAAVVAATARTPVAADHEERGRIVTLVGSLQSELGCPGDWAPGVRGDRPCATAATARWSITVDVPAGLVGVEGRPRRHVGPQLPDRQRAARARRATPT